MRAVDARVKLLCLVAYVVAALHARTPSALALSLAAAIACAAAARVDARGALKALLPLASIVVFTVLMQVLYLQQGTVLVQIGPVAVTREALSAAGYMVAGLVCIVVANVAFMRCTPAERLVDAFGWMLAPLRAFGVRVDAFMLSLSVAFRFVPVFAQEFGQLKRAQQARLGSFEGGVRQRVGAYMRLFPPLVRSSFRRADRLGEGFLCRCFANGGRRTSLQGTRLGWRDAFLMVVTAALVIAIFAF